MAVPPAISAAGPSQGAYCSSFGASAAAAFATPAASAGALLLRGCRRQRRRHDLLAIFDLDQKAFTVEIAILIERHVEQDAGILLGGNLRAVQCLGERLRIEALVFFRDRLDDVHRAVAFHAVVI